MDTGTWDGNTCLLSLFLSDFRQASQHTYTCCFLFRWLKCISASMTLRYFNSNLNITERHRSSNTLTWFDTHIFLDHSVAGCCEFLSRDRCIYCFFYTQLMHVPPEENSSSWFNTIIFTDTCSPDSLFSIDLPIIPNKNRNKLIELRVPYHQTILIKKIIHQSALFFRSRIDLGLVQFLANFF